jgi:rhodopsin domain-containing protein
LSSPVTTLVKRVAATKYGAGQHFLLLTVGSVKRYLKLFYVMNINLNLSATFIKLSLLCQFLRLFNKGTWAYRASIGGLVAVTLWGVTFVILSVFPCAVVSDAWNILARNPRCWGYASQDADLFTATLVSHNIINTIFDIYITAIPFQLYFQPDVTSRTRMGLMVLLLMGAT